MALPGNPNPSPYPSNKQKQPQAVQPLPTYSYDSYPSAPYPPTYSYDSYPSAPYPPAFSSNPYPPAFSSNPYPPAFSSNPYPPTFSSDPYPYASQSTTSYASPGGLTMPVPVPIPTYAYPDVGQMPMYPTNPVEDKLPQVLQNYPPQASHGYPQKAPSRYPQKAPHNFPPHSQQSYSPYPQQTYPSQSSQQAFPQPSQQAYPPQAPQAYPPQAYPQPSQQAYPTQTQQSHSNKPPPATFQNLAGGSSGQKKALLVGINYAGSKCPLKGCINDVHNMIDFLTRCAGFSRQNMVVLTDDNKNNPKLMPTRQNIMTEMQRLARGARKGDSLFFHFSGHGGQQKDTNGDEEDGFDETILPVDFQKAGMIVDDEMHQVLVKPLPAGCRLTCVFDSCHSGTALDLPYVYLPSGELKKRKTQSEKLLATAGQAGFNFLQGNKAGAVKTLFQMLAPQKKVDHKKVEQAHQSQADVIQFSGCKDHQTSADALIGGRHTGAMSYALLKSLRQNPSQSYSQLLTSTREVLAKEYSQIPQLSSGKLLDMSQAFRL